MSARHAAVLGWAAALIAVMATVGPALAGHEWIFLHHEDQGVPGQPAFEQCMPIESWNGHDDHIGDWYLGPYDNNECLPSTATPAPTTEVPTNEPTATPTENDPTATPSDEPTEEPTPTSTDVPQPTPTQTDATPTSTDTPTATAEPTPPRIEELPDTGLAPWEWDASVWQIEPFDNVWFGHNGDGGIGEEWVQLDRGDVYAWGPTDFEVVGVLRVDPADTWVLDLDYDAVLITCTGYNVTTGEWKYRLVVLLEELG